MVRPAPTYLQHFFMMMKAHKSGMLPVRLVTVGGLGVGTAVGFGSVSSALTTSLSSSSLTALESSSTICSSGATHNSSIISTASKNTINTPETGGTTTTVQSRWLGLQREVKFWSRVGPVVADYWWHLSSRSPYVQYQQWKEKESSKEQQEDSNDNDDPRTQTMNKKDVYNMLHERNAPKIYGIMVDLGGLYVKLGQVLSVTALPVPEKYRELFKTLQSNVPGHEEFESVIRPTLETELLSSPTNQRHHTSLDDIFESIDEIPVGSASIGQAHRAKLILPDNESSEDDDDDGDDQEVDNEKDDHNGRPKKKKNNKNKKKNVIDVIIKVQYPDARWQVPADIDCVGDFLKLCVYFGVVDESSASLSFEEFSRQFLSELDYTNEVQNLQETYDSSLDPTAPYHRRRVIIPKPFRDLCTGRIITMTYLPGPKFEEQARKQLESLGIDTKRGMKAVFEESEAEEASVRPIKMPNNENDDGNNVQSTIVDPSDTDQTTTTAESSSPVSTTTTTNTPPLASTKSKSKSSAWKNLYSSSWTASIAESIGRLIGVNNIFYLVRFVRRLYLQVTAQTVRGINAVTANNTLLSTIIIIPESLSRWAKQHEDAAYQAAVLNWTEDAIDSLFDVHGYQIFDMGLFNADPHPGNILVVLNNESNGRDDSKTSGRFKVTSSKTMADAQIGLIDWGQCKRLDVSERRRVARLILSVADGESDDTIASIFREMGIKTKNDSTEFLAQFARLMFGAFRPEHMSHSWHQRLHKMDRVTYFPNELSMVYRTSLLLRGLAMSFQLNVSVGDKWRSHAQRIIEKEETN